MLAAVMLAACGGTGAPETDSASAAPVAEVTTEAETTEPSPTPTPTPSPTPELPESPLVRELDMECNGGTGTTSYNYYSLERVWQDSAEAHTRCTIYDDMAVQLEVEQEALERAYGPDSDSLHILYSMCGETMMGNAGTFGPRPMTEGQRHETEGALVLCPEHPDAEAVRELVAIGAADDEIRAEGRMFHSGTYLVGEEVQPGTYVSESGDGEPFDGCYWELTDESGGIIDNFFSTSALRVELTVRSSAYSLTVDGCGEFRPAE